MVQQDPSPTTPPEEVRAGHSEITEEQGARAIEALGPDRLIEMYEQMTRIRRFEERAGRAYQQGKIKGFCHLYIGQEAVAVGAMNAIDERDYIVTAYREHGHALARGLTSQAVMAELFGRVTGSSKGMGGSMHIFDVEKKFYGGWGIVGGHIPTAAGIGWAIKYREEGAVCLCFFGDGSIPQGAFHETLNMAALWKLPVVFITENNLYGMGTSLERASSVTDLYKKALSYDIPHRTIDGQNVLTVQETLKECVERARETGEPTFLDVRTYRYRGHSMSDPATYRTKDEVKDAQQRDPIERLGRFLIEQEIRTEEQLKAIDQTMKDEAKEAEAFAESSDFPPLKALYEDAYVEWPWEHEGPALP